eukprot:1151652-Pelagomonas_calceolata.AAC.4
MGGKSSPSTRGAARVVVLILVQVASAPGGAASMGPCTHRCLHEDKQPVFAFVHWPGRTACDASARGSCIRLRLPVLGCACLQLTFGGAAGDAYARGDAWAWEQLHVWCRCVLQCFQIAPYWMKHVMQHVVAALGLVSSLVE